MDGSGTPSFLAETPAETAEFEAVKAGDTPEVETPEKAPAPTPEPKPEPKVEAKVEPKAEPKVEPDKPKFVPHAALHEERLKRQALEKELAELRAGKVAPEPEKAEPIDPESDPIAALKELRAWKDEQGKRAEQETQLRAFDDRVRAHEADFATATPDYGDAIKHLRESRAAQIRASAEALGQSVTDQQLGQILMGEARATSDQALRNGRNPGEVFYTLAKSFGYAGPKPAAPTPEVKTEPTPEPAVLPTKEASEKIARLTKGQQASNKTGGGEAPEADDMSLEALAKLDGAAFDKAFDKFTRSQKQAERH